MQRFDSEELTPDGLYKTMQTFMYNILETRDAPDELGWYPELKVIRGRSLDAVRQRIAAEARATKTQARHLYYRIYRAGEVVDGGSFGVRRRFRVGDRIQGTGSREQDSGRIEELEDERARVVWDSGAIAWCSLTKLRPYGRA